MSRRGIAVLLAVAALSTIGLAALGEPARTYRDYDFGTFWVMGRMLLDGKDQYDYAALVAAHRALGSRGLSIVLPGTASAYPLTTSFLFAPFALLPFSLAAPLWLVSQIVALVVALVALGRVLVPKTIRRDAFVLIGLLAASQPAWLLVQYGNMSGLLAAVAAVTTALLLSGRASAAGASAGALLLMKPHPLLMAMGLTVASLPRATAARAILLAASTAAAGLAVSIAIDRTWLGDAVSQLERVAAFGTRDRLPTLFGLLGPDLVWLAWAVVAILIVVFLVYLRSRPPLPLRIGSAVCLSLFAVPFGHAYDHVILAIPVLIALAQVREAAPPQRSIALLGLALAFVVVPWGLYVFAFRRGDEALNAITPLAVLAALALAARLGRLRVAGI